MEHISEPTLETSSEDAPAMEVLKAAFRGLIETYTFDQEKPFGSSTICVAVLDKRCGWLDLVNLGDSCVVVYRRGQLLTMAERRQCGFNRPLQLTLEPSGKARGNPNDADRQSLQIEDGDVLIMATDGLWDNMFMDQIEQRLQWYQADAYSSGSFDLEAFVLELINTARQTSVVEYRVNATPFAIESEKAGFSRPGGKMDDITVIAALAFKD
jgi:protein phosphatase PTC7